MRKGIFWIMGIIIFITLFLGWQFPNLLRFLLEKEGVVEQISHLIIFLAFIFGLLCFFRRVFILAVSFKSCIGLLILTIFFLFILFEEIDWGAIYGFWPFAEMLQEKFLAANLHNIRVSKNLGSYRICASPLFLFFILYLFPLKYTHWARKSFLPFCLKKEEVISFLIAIAIWFYVGTCLKLWESYIQELIEAFLYSILLTMAWRGFRVDYAKADIR